MSDERTNDLHLPDLSIRNFRGIKNLSIGRLGRVTLLAGRNGVGKTTILEAVRVYAARGHRKELAEVLDKREEFVAGVDKDNDTILSLDYAALFHGRTATPDQPIEIGPNSDINTLHIQALTLSDLAPKQQDLFADYVAEDNVQVFKVNYNNHENLLPWLSGTLTSHYWSLLREHRRRSQILGFDEMTGSDAINYESLGPGLPDNSMLASFWDSIVLTKEENLALKALHLVDNSIEGVAVIGDEENPRNRRSIGRRVVVKIRDHSHPVPLKSLGDGMTRLFAAGLALANCRNGFLIVDEVENGIHYSVQQLFWNMLLRAAQQYNVQVLASTHSYDCVKGFARAASAIDNVEGILVRLERKDSKVRAVEYTEKDLKTVGTQNIEVR